MGPHGLCLWKQERVYLCGNMPAQNGINVGVALKEPYLRNAAVGGKGRVRSEERALSLGFRKVVAKWAMIEHVKDGAEKVAGSANHHGMG